MNTHANNRKRSNYGHLGFVYVESWVVNQPTIVKTENGKIDSNKANTFSKKGTKDLLVVLIQVKTS
jgi:hypothetical protein